MNENKTKATQTQQQTETDGTINQTEQTAFDNASTTSFDEEMIVDLARRRLNAKRRMQGQVLDFILLCLYAVLMIAVDDFGTRLGLSLLFLLFWKIRLVVRILHFMAPSFKNGIRSYLAQRKKMQLETECHRLQCMSEAYVEGEMNKY